jgi:hypothetical protein
LSPDLAWCRRRAPAAERRALAGSPNPATQKIRTLRVPWANSMVYRTNVCNSGSALGSLLNVPDPVGDRSIGERDWGTSPGPLWRRFQPIGYPGPKRACRESSTSCFMTTPPIGWQATRDVKALVAEIVQYHRQPCAWSTPDKFVPDTCAHIHIGRKHPRRRGRATLTTSSGIQRNQRNRPCHPDAVHISLVEGRRDQPA